jgi:hypothetical protein
MRPDIRRSLARLLAAALMVVLAGAKCGDEDASTVRRLTADGDVVLDSAGLRDVQRLPVDAGLYARWVVAQRELDAIDGFTVPTAVDLHRFDDDDIARAAAFLNDDDRAHAALRRAEISADEFVRTSVALAQFVATAEAAPPSVSGPVSASSGAVAPSRAEVEQTYAAARVRVVGADSHDASGKATGDGPRKYWHKAWGKLRKKGDKTAAHPKGRGKKH